MKKGIICLLIIAGGICVANHKTIRYEWQIHKLKTELKDAYSQSRYYEKMGRHGMIVPEEKWEEIHNRVNEIKAEIQFMKNMKDL